ncbi:MAG TPA: DNA modification methylase [Patescibacteria group bacterium]|nr:DNA modification methylase [Patescibacteria group bacterium]
MLKENQLKVIQVPIKELKPSEYNPRRWSADAIKQLKDSITRFGLVDPIIVNIAQGREQIVIGGHFRLKVAKDLGFHEVPVVYLDIPDVEKEKELNIRLNKNLGEFDFDLLKSFGEDFLSDLGFSSEDLDRIFEVEDTPEMFDLEKELKKLDIKNIEIQKGDLWDLGGSRMYCGDSTIEEDMLALMGKEKADMVLTDPPYILDYLKGKKKHGKAIEGFGYKRDRKYLETDFLPEDFTEKWMTNVHKVQKDDFHIIVYENWKNIRTIWNEMEKYWKVKNMIVWHLPNRVQNFSSKYKLFNKHDIAMVGTNKDLGFNFEQENRELQNEYETALYAISGKPAWESYEKGKKYCPTDFIEFNAADEKSSGQGIIFGTKPTEILIPYIKILTKRNDLILEPFGGSGSTLIAATKMKRRCYLMEKSPIYAEVIRKRWENLTGQKAKLISKKEVKDDKQK